MEKNKNNNINNNLSNSLVFGRWPQTTKNRAQDSISKDKGFCLIPNKANFKYQIIETLMGLFYAKNI